MKVEFNDVMTCTIFQHSRDISAKQGKYIDMKLEPERISELPETKEWPALGEFLVCINMTNLFRTTGCNSNYDQVDGGYSFPFVDIALDDPRLRNSEEACAQMREVILALDGNPTAIDLTLKLAQSEASLPDGEIVPSTRIWFCGKREDAEAAFPLIANALDRERVPYYLSRYGLNRCHHRHNLFVPEEIILELTSLEGNAHASYVCQQSDIFAEWQFCNDGVSINISLGDNITSPQWNVHVKLGEDEAHYQGDVMELPLYRAPARLKIMARWQNLWVKTGG